MKNIVRREDLSVVFQPIVDMTSGKQYATEALVRQCHADGVALWTWPTTEPEGIEISLDVGADAVMGDDVPAMVDAVRRSRPVAS